VDSKDSCLHLVLETTDNPQLPVLQTSLPKPPSSVVADKAYDTNNVLDTMAQYEAEAVIPPRDNRINQRDCDEN
jgi:hypothetical protein